MKCAVYDATGKLLRINEVPADQVKLQARAELGEYLYVGEDITIDDRIDPATRRVLKGAGVQATPPLTPAQRRRGEMPVRELLDLLWEAMDAGELPRATKFYNRLKVLRDKHQG